MGKSTGHGSAAGGSAGDGNAQHGGRSRDNKKLSAELKSRRKRRRSQGEHASAGDANPSGHPAAAGRIQPAAVVTLVAVLLIGSVLAYFIARSGPKPSDRDVAQSSGDESAQQTNASSSDKPPHDGWVKVGGVWRPASDVDEHGSKLISTSGSANAANDISGDGAAKPKPDPVLEAAFGNAGKTELLALDANPHVKSVAAALGNTKHPERLTSFVKPKAFDRQAFLADPKSYLETVEPGRVYQAAQPGENVKPIKRLSARYQRVVQGETVTFRVEVEPNMPVTFHSSRLGQFENKLSTQTVQANAEGIAEVQFTATPGTRDDIDVLAASPVNSNQARFVVHVELPQAPPKVTQAGR